MVLDRALAEDRVDAMVRPIGKGKRVCRKRDSRGGVVEGAPPLMDRTAEANSLLGGEMVETRPTQEPDHPGILAITQALPDWFDTDARGRAIPNDLKHQHGFVALAGGQVVGFITLFFAEGRINIGWMGVKPGSQRNGIGSALLGAAEAFGRERGVTEIATYTLGAGVDYAPYESTRAFYFKNGFTIYQTNETDNPGCPEEIRIKKEIARL